MGKAKKTCYDPELIRREIDELDKELRRDYPLWVVTGKQEDYDEWIKAAHDWRADPTAK